MLLAFMAEETTVLWGMVFGKRSLPSWRVALSAVFFSLFFTFDVEKAFVIIIYGEFCSGFLRCVE